MIAEWFPILVLFGFGIALAGGFVIISSLLGRKIKTPSKLSPYECGIEQETNPRQRFSVKFFLTAVVFLLFDVEVTFLLPWAKVFKAFNTAGLGYFIFLEGMTFIIVLAIGLYYVLKKGILNWTK